jgi:hypothetical protein
MTPDPVITPSITTWGETNTPTIAPLVPPVLEVTNENILWKDKDFWAYQNNSDKKSIIDRLSMDIAWSVLGMTIFVTIGLVFLVLAKINVWSDEKNADYSSMVQTYKEYITDIDGMIWYPWINKYKELITSINNENINSTINSAIPFIFKKDILEETVGQVVSSILIKNQELQDINKDINKYGFIHPDIMSILDSTKEQIPIMVSLHTLETIKFWTALKIFSMLDTFLQQASQVLSISKETLSNLMTTYTQRWEKDIANYLSMCYLNPYEQLPNCDIINDFNNYFIYEDKDTNIDTTLFSNIFSLVDSKLEKSDIASLQIDFNRFDPNQKNIWFRVTVNTLAEDDVAFMARGIINPHIFIISTLVTLLKQSFFVIGDSINIDKLNIKQQTITIWNIQIPVNTSFMVFDLPLQNSSEREIFDFYDNY